jgi:aminoglycoside phosphotransferase (APT) family kinase protein
LIELAHRHVARAPHPDPAWAFEEYRRCLLGTAWLTERPRTKSLGRELTEVLERLGPSSARSQDIVHNDFHYRNYLCEEDRVTGVFDWEGAVAGDWRYDLATLAFWSGLASEYTDEARRLCLQALAAACDPALVAFLGIAMTTRVIGFYEEVRPESVSPKLELVEANIASWWR